MKRTLLSLPILLIGVVLTGGLALAQGGGLAGQDVEFVTKAAQGNNAEVMLGKMATEKAESAEVKQFGERLVQDHSQANEKLMAIAQQKGVEVSQGLSPEQQQLHDRLAGLSGEEFDREYMSAMVEDHRKDIEMYQTAAQQSQIPEIQQQYAEQTLPTLQEHLEMAQSVHNQLQ